MRKHDTINERESIQRTHATRPNARRDFDDLEDTTMEETFPLIREVTCRTRKETSTRTSPDAAAIIIMTFYMEVYIDQFILIYGNGGNVDKGGNFPLSSW